MRNEIMFVMMDNLNIDVKEMYIAQDEFNSWSGKATMMIDFDDGKTWTDVGEGRSYHNDTIYCIVGKDDLINPSAKYGMRMLIMLADLKKEYLDNGETDLLINSLDIDNIK